MKYEIEFSDITACGFCINIYNAFHNSERAYENSDIMRNIVNTVTFKDDVNKIKMFGADTEVGSYLDGEYLRIGYSRINSYEFVKNGELDLGKLRVAIGEIAHPESSGD